MHKGCLRRVGLWTCMVVIAWGLGLAETAHAQKVGIVDLQAVLDQSVRGRAAKDRLRELGDKLQQEIKSKLEFKRQKEEELQKLQTEFRTQKYEPLYGGRYSRVPGAGNPRNTRSFTVRPESCARDW